MDKDGNTLTLDEKADAVEPRNSWIRYHTRSLVLAHRDAHPNKDVYLYICKRNDDPFEIGMIASKVELMKA
jgi:hypothetical protein